MGGGDSKADSPRVVERLQPTPRETGQKSAPGAPARRFARGRALAPRSSLLAPGCGRCGLRAAGCGAGPRSCSEKHELSGSWAEPDRSALEPVGPAADPHPHPHPHPRAPRPLPLFPGAGRKRRPPRPGGLAPQPAPRPPRIPPGPHPGSVRAFSARRVRGPGIFQHRRRGRLPGPRPPARAPTEAHRVLRVLERNELEKVQRAGAAACGCDRVPRGESVSPHPSKLCKSAAAPAQPRGRRPRRRDLHADKKEGREGSGGGQQEPPAPAWARASRSPPHRGFPGRDSGVIPDSVPHPHLVTGTNTPSRPSLERGLSSLPLSGCSRRHLPRPHLATLTLPPARAGRRVGAGPRAMAARRMPARARGTHQ